MKAIYSVHWSPCPLKCLQKVSQEKMSRQSGFCMKVIYSVRGVEVQFSEACFYSINSLRLNPQNSTMCPFIDFESKFKIGE